MKRFARVFRSLLVAATLFSVIPIAYAAESVTSRLPLIFEPNQGQSRADVRFRMHGGKLEGEFQRDGVILTLPAPGNGSSRLRMHLLGSRADTTVSGNDKLQSRTNYLLGNDPAHWLHGLPNYARVRYSGLYPGTDLVFYGNGSMLEHDFEVMPGANPSSIAFDLEGAESVTLTDSGDLRVELPGGAITFERPIAYQTVDGVRRKIDSAFTVDKDRSIRFRLGDYDRSRKLVIDPVLSFATYLSPLAPDANLIAIDGNGNNYVAGYASLGYPVTTGAFTGCTGCTANEVVTFISKLSADGTTLIYSTVLGGNNFAQPTGIGVDANGNVLVSGWTGASNFPTKNGQPIAPPNNAYLGFLVSLSPDGSSLNYGTMLGSPPSVSPAATTYATAMTLDSSGNAYVTGETGDGFSTTPGALNQAAVTNSRNSFDVYLAKFNPAGTLVYSAVLGTADPQNGGGGPIGSTAIAVDAAGDAFVAGQAGTVWPISSNAYLKQIAGSMPYATPFVTEVAPDAKSLIYSTYLDYAYVLTGITVLPNGNAMVAGNEAGSTYPTTPNAYEQDQGGHNAFLTELNSNGSSLAYSTMIGDGSFKINGIALDPDGDIWLAGQTSNAQFPLVNPIQATAPPGTGPFQPISIVNQLDPTGQTMKFATFLGGSAPGYASSIAIDGSHRAHVSGAAQYGMFTTPGVYGPSVPVPGQGFAQATYAYVALIESTSQSATLCLGGTTGLSFGYLFPQTSASQKVQVTNCGNAPLTISSIASSNAAFTVPAASNGCTGTIAVGGICTVSVQFTPTAVQSYSGQLTFTSNAAISTTSISLSGSGGEPSAGFGPPGLVQNLIFSPMLIGQTSAAALIGLYNNGTVPLTINLAQITVTTGFALGQGGTCTSTLAPGQSCWISVVFAPVTAGNITGTLSVSSNDPVNPIITTTLTGTAFSSYPTATITALLNPSYPTNSGTVPITMEVIGTNFFSASVVYINGVAQPTNYRSGTVLTVTFSPTILNAVASIPVTVVNPTPGGGASAPYPLIVYLSLPLTASALTSDPVGGLLYAAIPSSAAQNPNTIIPINPATGVALTPIPVATGPRALAVSDDGSELYVAATGVLQRINLKTYSIEKTFNLPVDPEWGQTYVQEMHVVPGSPQSIVVELFANVDPAEDGAALYNVSGLVNWIPGVGSTGSSLPLEMDSFTFTSSSTTYGLPMGSPFFTEVTVSPTGLSYGGGGGGAGGITQQTGSILRSDGTLLYTNSGEVWNPSTQQLLGTYLEADGSQLFYTESVVPDTANGHTYFLDGGAQYSQYQALSIDVFDQTSYALQGTVPFINIYSPDAIDLVRWGTNGFAFRSLDFTGSDASENQIVIVTSNLVSSNIGAPIPILSSVSPSPLYVGGPAFTMQVSGSGFTSGSTVLINGNPRTTTYVNGNSLTAQVLASDIASTGQLSVQVTTPGPGGGTSDQVTVAVENPPVTTPTVSVTPSATSITTAQGLTVTITVGGTTGKPTPTGSVTLSGGGYSSSASTLSSGIATFSIPIGALTAGTDTLTAYYSPDISSATTYNNASGSASVTVTVPKSVSTITVNPASSTITNAETDLVSITVAGVTGQPAPTGTVTLTSGSYSAQQTLSSGAASFTIPAGALASGANTLTATYGGDSSYSGSTSTTAVTVSQVILTSPAPAGVSPGSSSTSTVTLTAGSNYSGTMNVGCSLTNSPTGAVSLPTCSLSPVSVVIAAGGTGTTTFTVNTIAASNAHLDPANQNLWRLGGGTVLAGLLMLWIPRKRRRSLSMLLVLLGIFVAGAVACGGSGGGNTGNPPPGTSATTAGSYVFTVTGTDSAHATITASTTVTVTVE
jgi:hypothetical protein